jgi:hypothetical protein
MQHTSLERKRRQTVLRLRFRLVCCGILHGALGIGFGEILALE